VDLGGFVNGGMLFYYLKQKRDKKKRDLGVVGVEQKNRGGRPGGPPMCKQTYLQQGEEPGSCVTVIAGSPKKGGRRKEVSFLTGLTCGGGGRS